MGENNVRCYWGHVGERTENLGGNILRTHWEQQNKIKNLRIVLYFGNLLEPIG
jgi:hypothetical protein